MPEDTEARLIERVKEEMRKRRDINKALIRLINDFDMDMHPEKPFSTHTECYTETQMVEMIRTWIEVVREAERLAHTGEE